MTSKEVQDAAGEAPERLDFAALELEARRLRVMVTAKSERDVAAERLAAIEALLATRRETEGRAAAKARIVGLRKDLTGGHGTEYEKEVAAVHAAYAALSTAIGVLNKRAAHIRDLHAEANALADRFDLPTPTLPNPRSPDAEVDLPPALPLFWRFAAVVTATEWDEHQLRERRTYTEVGGSAAGRIIAAAGGPKPWPALTPEQQAEVAERVQDKVDERRQQAELARAAATLVPGVPDVRTFAARRGPPKPATVAETIGE